MNNELYHYGVKGMHWGVRRYQPYPKGYSGSGKYVGKHGRVGKMSWKQINRATEKAIAKSYAKDNTEEELRRKRNLSIALGVGGAGLGLGIYAVSKKLGKNSTIKAQKAKNLSDLSSKFTNNARNFDRGGKSALGAGLAVLGGGAINAARINNAIKLKKQNSKIKGVSNSEAESKKEKRKRILLGSAAIAGGAAALGLTAYGIKKRTDAGKKMHTIMESLERRKASRKNPSVKHLSEQFDKYNKVYDKYDKLVDFAPTLAGASAIPVVVDNIIKRRKQKIKIKGIDDYDNVKRREKIRNRILVGAGAGLGYGLTGSFDNKKRRRRR